jgi:hypothetical protein
MIDKKYDFAVLRDENYLQTSTSMSFRQPGLLTAKEKSPISKSARPKNYWRNLAGGLKI